MKLWSDSSLVYNHSGFPLVGSNYLHRFYAIRKLLSGCEIQIWLQMQQFCSIVT